MKLILNHVAKAFDDKHVLEDVSFTFEEGHIYALLGRNGAGKTTLFSLINEDLAKDGGTIRIEDGNGLRDVDGRDLGYVLSTPIVPNFLTGREFVRFFMEINTNEKATDARVNEWLDLMDIPEDSRDLLLKDYSHGMKNKMMMVVNFIADPPVWMLDEPLTSLDVVVADEMKRLLRMKRDGHILIFSTHIMELALSMCDRIVLLKDGVLEELERGDMDEKAFEDMILDALRTERERERAREVTYDV